MRPPTPNTAASASIRWTKVSCGSTRGPGQVSLCNHKTLGWACETIPDERSALENEIARLQNGNAALKKELLARGLALPDTVKPEPPLAKSDKSDKAISN